MDSSIYEKLGLFYLGREWDQAEGETTEDLVLYDSKDLNTHAVCVGMTGSGKTGLCIGLLEEALLDQVPVIAIDVKGDITNLMLTFPEMRAEDFEPWVDPAEASGKGKSTQEFAAGMAELWESGIGKWGQGKERVKRLKESADFTIFTPGSNAGVPLSVLKSFDAPSQEIIDDGDLFSDKISAAVSGILSLVGVDADPVQSREYILLARIFEHYWREGSPVSLTTLIKAIQHPPFETIGIMEVDTVFPGKDRLDFAMTINNLFASPSFAAWLKGEAMDIQKLLWTADGKPRCSIITIAHLSEKERMFFVSLLLNEVVSWMRSQTGTSSLRAILYMDEVFGYFPPVANPPSKKPMLTLLKQARAFGLGVVLATQNPVDLDYKGLSNTGTWFIGRLQTDRDKQRVLDGLEGANTASGKSFNRSELDKLISGLGKRVFLMNNVHENGHTLFHTRWVLSYLRGPLTRNHIQALMEERKAELKERKPVVQAKIEDGPSVKPSPPKGMSELFLHAPASSGQDENRFFPGVLAEMKLHYADKRRGLDYWEDKQLLVSLADGFSHQAWNKTTDLMGAGLYFEEEQPEKARYAALPFDSSDKKAAKSIADEYEEYAYRELRLTLLKCEEVDITSEPGESERDFKSRLRQALQEKRDEETEKLRQRYEKKVKSITDDIDRAEERVAREKSQYDQQKLQTVISFGSSLLGSLFGRRRSYTTSARGVGRTMRERTDVKRSQQKLKRLYQEVEEIEKDLIQEIDELNSALSIDSVTIETTKITPRKSDIEVEALSLVWIEEGVELDV